MIRDSWAGLISETWSRIASKVSDSFGLGPLRRPNDLRPSADTKTGYFGGWIDEDILYLTNECLRGAIPHIGVLAREYMRMALSKQDFEETVLEDFSLAYGAFWLPSKKMDNWYTEWKKYCPYKGDELGGVFFPHSAFQLFQTFSGSDYYGKLLTEYLLMKKMGLVLSESEYILHMLERIRRFSVKLNLTDFGLIRRLIEVPKSSRIDLSTDTGTSVHWVSRRLASLQEYGILEKHREIFYPGLGFKQYLLFLKCPERRDPLDYVVDSPFLYSASRIISGNQDMVATLLIPDNSMNVNSLSKYSRIMRSLDVETSFYEVLSTGSTHCFDHYSTSRNEWEIPWELFGPHLRRIYDESLGNLIIPATKRCEKAKLRLEDVDFRVLIEFQKGDPLRTIRRKLGIKYQKLVSRLGKLKALGLVEEKYRLHHVGLNESLLLHLPDFDFGESITAWAQRLPFVRYLLHLNGEMSLILSLPDGGLQGMATALQNLSKGLKPMLLDSYELPGIWYTAQSSWYEKVKDLWDTKMQTWGTPQDDISMWFEGLSGT
ncbi:MAG: hypothetical protein ACFFEF_06100 [Candidatus Thorarchaeota archaeon]